MSVTQVSRICLWCVSIQFNSMMGFELPRDNLEKRQHTALTSLRSYFCLGTDALSAFETSDEVSWPGRDFG